jgi:hypothetical protein
MRGLDNCVGLCRKCHLLAGHGGNFRAGPVAPPIHFAFTGMSRSQLDEALRRWNRMFDSLGDHR